MDHLTTSISTSDVTIDEESYQVFKHELAALTLFWKDRAHEEELNMHYFRGKLLLEFHQTMEQEQGLSVPKSVIIRLSKELGMESSASTFYKEMTFASMVADCEEFDEDLGMYRLNILKTQEKLNCHPTWRNVALHGITQRKNVERVLTHNTPDVVSCNTLQKIILDEKPFMVQLMGKSGAVKARYVVAEFEEEPT